MSAPLLPLGCDVPDCPAEMVLLDKLDPPVLLEAAVASAAVVDEEADAALGPPLCGAGELSAGGAAALEPPDAWPPPEPDPPLPTPPPPALAAPLLSTVPPLVLVGLEPVRS